MTSLSRLTLLVAILFVLLGLSSAPALADNPVPAIADASNSYCDTNIACDPSIPPARRFELAGPSAAMNDPSMRETHPLAPESGGSDGFGYTWTDGVPFQWIDATGGTNAGLTGSSHNKITAPIALPFTFKFYENRYTNIKIAAGGFVTFADSNLAPWQGHVPDPYAPNNLIAPYWAPFYLDGKGKNGKVFYSSGGTAPNRYFVVEWNNVLGGPATDTVGGNDTFRFELVLNEDSSFVIQYATMQYRDNYWCGAGGSEDSSGTIGISVVKYCKKAPSKKAIKFTRPAPRARLTIPFSNQGDFAPPNGTVTFPLTLRNTGDLGADTFNFTCCWAIGYYDADGVTPLTDTDSDTHPDTGVIAEGASRTIQVKFQVDANFHLGARYYVTPHIQSANGVDQWLHLPISHAPDFAQAFRNDDKGALSLDLIRNSTQNIIQVTPDNYNAANVGLIARPDGNYVYAWNKSRCVNARCRVVVEEIEYTLLDHDGVVLHSIQKLKDFGSPKKSTYAYAYGMQALADNTTGVAWIQETDDTNGTWNQNVWFTRLDASGNPVGTPRNLTRNTLWGNSSSPNVPFFYNARVVATADNRFIVVWQREVFQYGKWTNDIYYRILDASGNPLTRAINFTKAATGLGYYSPAALALADGNVLLAFIGSTSTKREAFFGVISSKGSVIKPVTNITNDYVDGYDWYYMAASQASDGNIMLAWSAYIGQTPANMPLIRRIVLAPDFSILHPPAFLMSYHYGEPSESGAGAVSVTSDDTGHTVLTWQEAHPALRHALYFAVLPVPDELDVMSFQHSSTYISTSFGGLGNAK
jgi:hypothetical protein